MFNVTVLKMKDILKYFVGIILTFLIVFFVSRGFGKNNENNESRIEQNLEKGINFLSENSMLYAIEQTIPVISNINEEYKNISKEDDANKKENVLEIMLETQISSIKAIENATTNTSIEETNKETENKQQETNNTNENQTIAEAGTTTEIITQNPISDGSNTIIRKCKNKK